MKPILLAAMVAFVGLLGPREALAGIVVIDGRVATLSGFNWTGTELQSSLSATTHSEQGASGTGGTGSSSDASSGTPARKVDGLGPITPIGPIGPVGPIEYKQIQSGLITEEEAMSGCGGASAATGPASLLPMLVAGGALLRRRARTLRAEGENT